MRIYTTFNDDLYEASGRFLLESIQEHLPKAELVVYSELTRHQLSVPTVTLENIPEFKQVKHACLDLIPEEEGGHARQLHGFNKRWFNWFRKVVTQYDALTRHPYNGYSIFLDSDTRILKSFSDEDISNSLKASVGVFRGQREAIEAGLIIYDQRQAGAYDFVDTFMQLFLSGEFRQLKRWDDGYVMTEVFRRHPDLVQDFAESLTPESYTNSNGHTTSGHVLPLTKWGSYVEHDKGIHWRSGVAAAVHEPSAWHLRWRTLLKRLFARGH